MKLLFLHLLKITGFFQLAKYLVRKKMLIIAYHGVEMSNESEFNPNLFIKRSTLEQRMKYLGEGKFNILGLDDAIDKLETNRLPDNSVVITVDDGWYSTLHHADKVFSDHAYPYTIYVTSYFVEKNYPVTNIALQYVVWSSNKSTIDLDTLGIQELSGQHILQDEANKQHLLQRLFAYCSPLDISNKLHFIKNVCALLEVNFNNIETERFLSLMSSDEIKQLSKQGVDIQLHTHTHNIPLNDKRKAEDEILQNKEYLSAYTNSNLAHFCYPSGRYDNTCESLLQGLGVRSATTCEPGFITKENNRYYLPRFLDGENIHRIIFEAEMCGVLFFLRKTKNLLKNHFRMAR